VRWSVEHDMVVRRFGEGVELVWLHGLGEWSVNFEPIARHFAFEGYTHVLPDLPGYGRSPWTTGFSDDHNSLERLADRLAVWMAARPPAVVLGHSMGGVLATLVAERVEVRGVVNIDGNLSRGDCSFSAEAAAYSLDDFAERGFALLKARVYERGVNEAPLRGYHAALCAASPAVFHRHARDLVALSESETLAARLAAVPTRRLFVAGVPGGICARSHTLIAQHDIALAPIEHAGHWVFVDQPDAFAAIVAKFLASLA
jgi:pimeloyl-ACP methyl ester carboxylesterase